MNLFNMIKFIGSKSPKYKWENIVDDLPYQPVKNDRIKPLHRKDVIRNTIVNGTLDKNGRQGNWVIYDGDKLFMRGYYKNDKLDGFYEDYFNDKIASQGFYKNDKLDGVLYAFNRDGAVFVKEIYKDDIKIDTIYPNNPKYWDI